MIGLSTTNAIVVVAVILGVLVIALGFAIWYCVRARRLHRAMQEQAAWAQRRLDIHTTPLGLKPEQVQDVLQRVDDVEQGVEAEATSVTAAATSATAATAAAAGAAGTASSAPASSA